ncbi:MAG: AI-2E family transporter, partial [SAR202 cluster bacterium]|nr:AI-2E family transporter [SAR202 cluster bacterium]
QTTWQRWRRVGMVVAILLVVISVLWFARGALFPFAIAIILAELLHPLVDRVERFQPWSKRFPGAARIAAILVIYVIAAAVVTGLGFLIVPPLFQESQEFIETVPELYESARATIEEWGKEYTERIPEELRSQLELSVESGGEILGSAARSLMGKTLSGVTNAVTLVIGLAIVPFMLFYILKDGHGSLNGFYSALSPDNERHARNVVSIIHEVIGAYIRAQLFSALIVGVAVFLGLFILGVKFAALLGLIAGLFGLIPIIGPLLGAIPGLLVTLATSRDDMIWVVVLYLVVQFVESNIISPRIQSKAVNIHPALILVVLVIASETSGLWGVVIGVPLTAAARDVFVYFYDEWTRQQFTEPGQPETDEEQTEGPDEPEDAHLDNPTLATETSTEMEG